jgi:sterol desaturase/sphingolipid hydroxylase (fatty acid hydroxylase superfamily)
MHHRPGRRILADAGYATLSSFSLAFGHMLLAALPHTGVFGPLSQAVRLWERPFWLQLLVAFLISEIILYVWHRAQHESGSALLWSFHAFHHRAPEMMSVTGGRASLIDLSMAMISLSVVALLGVHHDALMFILWYSSMLGSLHHSDLDIRLGWLNWLIPGPQQHHAHHHIEPSIGRNYATNLPLLDVLLGTTTPLVRLGTIQLGVHGDPER